MTKPPKSPKPVPTTDRAGRAPERFGHDPRTEDPGVEEMPPRAPSRPDRATLDLAHRPGPGETRRDAERSQAAPDPEEQNGGRALEEEIFLNANEDDAGGLPNQAIANRGPLATDAGREPGVARRGDDVRDLRQSLRPPKP